LDMCLEFSPAREAELMGQAVLGFAQPGAGVAGAECAEAFLAEFLEPLEIGAERERTRSGHEDTFFPRARRPRLAGRKKVIGALWRTSGFDPARGPSAARHGLTSL